MSATRKEEDDDDMERVAAFGASGSQRHGKPDEVYKTIFFLEFVTVVTEGLLGNGFRPANNPTLNEHPHLLSMSDWT